MSAKRLPPQEQLRIVLEGLRGDVKLSELCRRENIYPNEYYRMKDRVISGAIESLKNNRKKKDAEKEQLLKENEKLQEIILNQAEEITLLKKRTNSNY
ncbi:MAG: hypothetical protein COT45_04700 [bacterium (Candidatus Stahlbacteria) CG08_land_8_20_14_0_20_40_26]|nr:MAG: hypothetical protein COX49_01020 [bacterium (Candidatus Stahlbacteria) CG23_combo_of_CG06-09_8_20_14_all_40_9]PIS24193.1 MAG: hypothetical protein COT45_04700 [bacterium (Candidatus Stahlbacteria) CG08_land_8_20_14_0_20_40_26]